MIDAGYVRLMARYNRWQNESLYGVADALSDADRRRARGAFFGSIHATLNHLLWADRIWMSRFADVPRPPGGIPESVALHESWEELKRERATFDAVIVGWADALEASWPDGNLTYYSGVAKRDLTRPRAELLLHFFNHQTHHRGQAHALLSARVGNDATPSMDLIIFQRETGIGLA
jgi:uncharacterized damage-inducible protein DinB